VQVGRQACVRKERHLQSEQEGANAGWVRTLSSLTDMVA
jgi:hypothetical protein